VERLSLLRVASKILELRWIVEETTLSSRMRSTFFVGVIQDNALLAEELLETLEAGEPVVAHTMTESQPPGLVQLTTTILEEALSRHTRQTKSPPATQLITSAMSVLSALLALPQYSNRVWLYIRSTAVLYGSIGCTSTLSSERVTGHYTMTLALLHLVRRLFHEASSSMLTVLPDNPRLQQVKEEVLLRAARFVHSQIWVEHLGWKYAQLGDKFEIGRRVSSLSAEIMKHSP
jgi:nuclear pore complex protein Nup188